MLHHDKYCFYCSDLDINLSHTRLSAFIGVNLEIAGPRQLCSPSLNFDFSSCGERKVTKKEKYFCEY